MAIKRPSSSVLAARQRRKKRQIQQDVKIEWFIKEVMNKTKFTLKQRVTIATNMVKDKVVKNISRPVTKGTGPRGGRVVTNRSKPGEFPKADTTQLMKSIFGEVVEEGKDVVNGYVGTPLKYGLILETKMNRSFLKRTLEEEIGKVREIMAGPLKLE